MKTFKIKILSGEKTGRTLTFTNPLNWRKKRTALSDNGLQLEVWTQTCFDFSY